jgi:hypothetical protein
MFSKISRYRTLPNIVTADGKSRALESKGLRLLPEVSGEFLHTVEDVDRLDHLAYKYYKQPRKWWRICDANPDFMAPQALLGKYPVKTVRFYLSFNDNGANPPWHDLISRLLTKTGVEKAMLMEEVNLVPDDVYQVDDQSLLGLRADGVPDDVLVGLETIKDQGFIGKIKFVSVLKTIIENDSIEAFISLILNHTRATLDGEIIIGYTESFKHFVLITYNKMNTDLEKLSNTIIEAGFIIEQSETIGQIGKSIIIPANITG